MSLLILNLSKHTCTYNSHFNKSLEFQKECSCNYLFCSSIQVQQQIQSIFYLFCLEKIIDIHKLLKLELFSKSVLFSVKLTLLQLKHTSLDEVGQMLLFLKYSYLSKNYWTAINHEQTTPSSNLILTRSAQSPSSS